MTPLAFKLQSEPFEEQSAARRVNPCEDVLVTVEGRNLRLKSGHGQSDFVYLWQDGASLYLLNTNSRYGYVGLAQYDISDSNSGDKVLRPVSETFLDNDEDINLACPEHGTESDPEEFRDGLLEYLC